MRNLPNACEKWEKDTHPEKIFRPSRKSLRDRSENLAILETLKYKTGPHQLSFHLSGVTSVGSGQRHGAGRPVRGGPGTEKEMGERRDITLRLPQFSLSCETL